MIRNIIKNKIEIIIIASIFLAAGYFVYSDLRSVSVSPPAADSDSEKSAFPGLVGASDTANEPSQSARVVPPDAREYRSAAYGFSLFYPKYLSAAEQAEGGGAATITFQNIETAQGFQIFIVPYSEPQVSEARFKQDAPTGVRESLTNIAVDGAIGAAFYGLNDELGPTREIWFIHGGWLYEVTTLKPLDGWLDEIMKTWKFAA